MPSLRTLLTLGRISNLPTVWSNCLAGWWLGGGGNPGQLALLIPGVSLLYVGGMFLNDAFDAEFDRQHRKERPVPSGAISVRLVWQIGFGLLGLGNALLFIAGTTPGVLGVILLFNILLYDAVHKAITFSPLLMGGCRFWVYVIAAAVGEQGVTGFALWSGLALGAYVAGLSFVARRESLRGQPPYWPILLLVVPVVFALLLNAGEYVKPAILTALILALWSLRALRWTYWVNERNPGRTVSALLAGIVLVDWLAVAYLPREATIGFLGLFLLALLSQRYVRAT